MKNKPMSADKVKISLAVTAVFITAITLIVVNQTGAQESTQSIGELIGVSSVESLVSGLESRLKERPDDLNGWVLLASSYYHIHRIDDAKKAFEQAKALGYKGEPTYASGTANARSSSPLLSPLPRNSFLQQYLNNNQRVKHSSHGGNADHQKLVTKANSTTDANLDLTLDPALSKTVGLASER